MLALRPNYTAASLSSFVHRLSDIGAVKIDTKEGFRLKLHETNPQAPLSPFYFNLRLADNKQGPLTYNEVQTMADFMLVYIIQNQLKFDGICGIPRAGDPFAEELQKLIYQNCGWDIPRLTLDKIVGDQIRRVGNVVDTSKLAKGSRVLLIDDLITKADSKFEAIERLRESGYVVEDCIVFLDREQGGSRQMNTKGVKLHSIMGLTSVLNIMKFDGRIDDSDLLKIRSYLTQAA